MFVFHIRFFKLLPQKMMIKSAISTNVMTKKIWQTAVSLYLLVSYISYEAMKNHFKFSNLYSYYRFYIFIYTYLYYQNNKEKT